jgi:hypothetical protein
MIVYEFAGQKEQMMHALVEALTERLPELRVSRVGGVFVDYRQGGLGPQRLANLIWVYFSTALHLLFCRPDAILVHTSPPGVHLWTVAWAAIGRVPVLCWLMDYHPEIEARAFEKRGLLRTARLLRRIDASLMPRFSAIITLDPAMTAVVHQRAPEMEIVEHPTWTPGPSRAIRTIAHTPGSAGGVLRLVYTGNLGLAHDLEPLSRLLATLQEHRPVRLLLIGTSPGGQARFRAMAQKVRVLVEARPRVPLFSDLGAVYEEFRVDAGIVVLAKESAGLVSPSKFAGYIDFGLPVVYLGPPDTSSALVCNRFQGGFWIPSDESPGETERVASRLLDVRAMAAAADGARAAATHFQAFSGASLAAILAPRLRKIAAGGQ